MSNTWLSFGDLWSFSLVQLNQGGHKVRALISNAANSCHSYFSYIMSCDVKPSSVMGILKYFVFSKAVPPNRDSRRWSASWDRDHRNWLAYYQYFGFGVSMTESPLIYSRWTEEWVPPADIGCSCSPPTCTLSSIPLVLIRYSHFWRESFPCYSMDPRRLPRGIFKVRGARLHEFVWNNFDKVL